MFAAAPVSETPASAEEAAELLLGLGGDRRRVRVRGGGTKLGRSVGTDDAEVDLCTAGMAGVVAHNAGDFTAVLKGGTQLAAAQKRFAAAGQMLALDPPLGAECEATVGGILASADSGPLRHRYGGVRDLILGMQVVLSDGTLARSGGQVIKNVAGYDLGKLFAGARGTLGVIAEVAVRLHPLPAGWATARARSHDPAELARAAAGLAALPLEAESLDVSWRDGRGEVLVRFAGATSRERADAVSRHMRSLGLRRGEVVEDDEGIWEALRARQRPDDGVVVRAAGVIGDLERVLRVAEEHGGSVVSRAGLGLSWVALGGEQSLEPTVAHLGTGLDGMNLVVLDGWTPGMWRSRPAVPEPARQVMERIKARFDPAGAFPSPEWL